MAGDLHLPRSTMDVTVPGMAATTSKSTLCPPQGLLRVPSTLGAATAGGSGGGAQRQPGTPRKDDVLDDTFIDVSRILYECCQSHTHYAMTCRNIHDKSSFLAVFLSSAHNVCDT